MLAGQFRIRPHIARVVRESRHDPFTVGRDGREERLVDGARLVVPGDTVWLLGYTVAIDGPGIRNAVAVRQPMVERHGEPRRRLGSQQIEAVGVMDPGTFEADIVEYGGDHAGIGDSL